MGRERGKSIGSDVKISSSGQPGNVLPSLTPVLTKHPGGDYSFSEVGTLLAKGLPCCCCFDVGRTETAKHLFGDQIYMAFLSTRHCPALHAVILSIFVTALRGKF